MLQPDERTMARMQREAKFNLTDLTSNQYPGCGIIVGMDKGGQELIQVYWNMVRRPNSRNRKFINNYSGKIRTEPVRLNEVQDQSSIIYTAMDEKRWKDSAVYVVSNGSQTDAIIENSRPLFVGGPDDFRETMSRFAYEPDEPNFTPRISAACFTERNGLRKKFPYFTVFSLVKKWSWSDIAQQSFFPYSEFIPGFGLCITTYDGPGEPLPSFSGIPYILPLEGDIDVVTENFWGFLNEKNKISLSVKFIDIESGNSETRIVNKYA